MNLGSQATSGKYQEMMRFNPGKRMTTFPAYNPYTRKDCADCDGKGDGNELCMACRDHPETGRERRRQWLTTVPEKP